MKKNLILSSLFVLALSVVACQKNAVVENSAAEERSAEGRAGISVVNPLKAIVFFSNHSGTMVPGMQKIDFSGNTQLQLGFSPTFTGSRMVACESPAGSGTYAAPVAMTLTGGVGFLPCAELKDYSGVLSITSVINFKIGVKTFSTTIDPSISEFDQSSFHVAANDAFDGAAPVVDITNPAEVKVTLKEGALYDAAQLLATYDDFHYSVVYMSSGTEYVLEGTLAGPFTITDGGTVDAILGQDVADLVVGADAGSLKVVGYFLGTAASGQAHKLLTLPITLN